MYPALFSLDYTTYSAKCVKLSKIYLLCSSQPHKLYPAFDELSDSDLTTAVSERCVWAELPNYFRPSHEFDGTFRFNLP